jgi:hypothetical protein
MGYCAIDTIEESRDSVEDYGPWEFIFTGVT